MPPVHSADELYLAHDDEYDNYEGDSFLSPNKLSCDKMLVNGLRELPPDPRLWENPPLTDKEIEHAERYREAAMVFFEGKIDYAEVRNKYGREYMKSKYYDLYLLFEKD